MSKSVMLDLKFDFRTFSSKKVLDMVFENIACGYNGKETLLRWFRLLAFFFNTHVCMKRSRYFEELAREHTAGFGMLVV